MSWATPPMTRTSTLWKKSISTISDEEKRYIENAEVGSGLLIADKVVVPFNNTFPQDTELFRLMDTNPNRKK